MNIMQFLLLTGQIDSSMIPKCWYTWTVFSFLPILFVTGMAIQFGKTSRGHDHKRGKINGIQGFSHSFHAGKLHYTGHLLGLRSTQRLFQGLIPGGGEGMQPCF